MSKLLEDEKVAALVAKQVAAAIKAERKRALSVVQTAQKDAAILDDKVAKKTVLGVLKTITVNLKDTTAAAA